MPYSVLRLSQTALLSLFYILGLLLAMVPWGGYGLMGIGVVAGVMMPRLWRSGPRSTVWLLAGLIGLLASLYLQARVPQPLANDISRFVAEGGASQIVTVRGRVASDPQLTRGQKVRFFLDAKQLDELIAETDVARANQDVGGQVYVTVPPLQATGLQAGQRVAITGRLYPPQPATNPGGFDFQAYLARQGAFAGLSGYQVTLVDAQPPWGVWAVRQRIVRSLTRWLGAPEGLLVSSMVMGRRAVDLPYPIQDAFAWAGLAHTLAASGYHVSLLLGVVLGLTQRLPARVRVLIGVLTLTLFVSLTGLQPSVLRAAVMGVGALLALATERKIRSLGSLLLAAVLLLLFNPLWIWDLGFQLSFLATLGLLVTSPPLIRWLNWLPPTIAAMIAVPIAAYIWTLPLSLYTFGQTSPYAVLINVLTMPLIAVLSLGGMLSAVVGVLYPPAGSGLALLLLPFCRWLLAIVAAFAKLPGSILALGTLSLGQMLALYGLIILVWLQTWWQRRWWLAYALGIAIVAVPFWQLQTTLLRATVLSVTQDPILVIQDRGQVTLVNSGDELTARLTVLPFLQQQGTNRLHWAIRADDTLDLNHLQGWQLILGYLPVETFYAAQAPSPEANSLAQWAIQNGGTYEILAPNQTVTSGLVSLQRLETEPPLWQFQIHDTTWLWLGALPESAQIPLASQLRAVSVLWWEGGPIVPQLLAVLQPKVAIASASVIDPATLALLEERKTQVFWTGRDGALQWTPQSGVRPTLESAEATVW